MVYKLNIYMLLLNYFLNIYDDVDVYYDEWRKGRDWMMYFFCFKNKISKKYKYFWLQMISACEFMKKKFWILFVIDNGDELNIYSND